jgi:hypothetical protein
MRRTVSLVLLVVMLLTGCSTLWRYIPGEVERANRQVDP